MRTAGETQGVGWAEPSVKCQNGFRTLDVGRLRVGWSEGWQGCGEEEHGATRGLGSRLGWEAVIPCSSSLDGSAVAVSEWSILQWCPAPGEGHICV